jgi:rhodanese-related sulfurtransferase
MKVELLAIEPASEVIVYCACPNEASAVKVAKALMEHGFKRVRPLSGGIDAWIAAGYDVER